MQPTLIFLHTAAANVDTFDTLAKELAPAIPRRHVVDESLLQEALQLGEISPQLAKRVSDTIVEAAEGGARVLLCTCSTIGGCAEDVNQLTDSTVIRVDRPMAEKAVAMGSRIIVVATAASTIAPTRALILDEAHKANKQVDIVELFCESAWPKFEQGDLAGYNQEIADCLRQAATDAEVIVLAQASMAGAAKLLPDFPVPILSSPRLGLEAAISAYQIRA